MRLLDGIEIRPATEADVEAVFGLILELASYEELREEVAGDPDALRRTLFEQRAAEALLIEDAGEAIGYAIFYVTFSSFDAYPGLVIWHSRDLVNWQPVTAALRRHDHRRGARSIVAGSRMTTAAPQMTDACSNSSANSTASRSALTGCPAFAMSSCNSRDSSGVTRWVVPPACN